MTVITDQWLREHGFKWEDIPRSGRHWLLWIGQAIPDALRNGSAEDFGVELCRAEGDDWRLFLRADYAGRYSRFLFCRRLQTAEDLMRIIGAIIYPYRFDDCLTPYGYLACPSVAARLKKESEELHVRMLKQTEAAWHGIEAEDQAVHVAQRKPEPAPE